MRIKVDEDLPRAAVRMLRDKGYEALSVVEQGMGGYKDPVLWQAVQADEQRHSTIPTQPDPSREHQRSSYMAYTTTRIRAG